MMQENTLYGRFTISGTKTIEFQIRAAGTISGPSAANFGTEVYAELLIWKVA
jgi:hypothetical protein